MILITLVVIVMSILIFCPMIILFFFKPYNYIKTNVIAVIEQQLNILLKMLIILKKSITNFINSLEFADELNEQLKNMKIVINMSVVLLLLLLLYL